MSKYTRRHQREQRSYVEEPHSYRALAMPTLDAGELAETEACEDSDEFRDAFKQSAMSAMQDLSALSLQRMRAIKKLGGWCPPSSTASMPRWPRRPSSTFASSIPRCARSSRPEKRRSSACVGSRLRRRSRNTATTTRCTDEGGRSLLDSGPTGALRPALCERCEGRGGWWFSSALMWRESSSGDTVRFEAPDELGASIEVWKPRPLRNRKVAGRSVTTMFTARAELQGNSAMLFHQPGVRVLDYGQVEDYDEVPAGVVGSRHVFVLERRREGAPTTIERWACYGLDYDDLAQVFCARSSTDDERVRVSDAVMREFIRGIVPLRRKR